MYFDNAATTWPKPKSVLSAVERAMREYGANPGRGGYDMASDTDAQVYGCRKRAADMFGAKSPEKVIFTPGCTYSINYVLRGVLRPGDHVIISNLEHNAVIRPLHYLHRCGVSVTRVDICEGDHDTTLRRFRSAIRRNTAMIFCTHASNVFGVQIPINSIGELCRREGILFGVDAAQSAGSIAIDVGANHIDYLCLPAHKGLYGIMGLGMLIICEDAPLPSPLIMGGTGSLSAIREQPGELPDRLESGTLNVPAICALRAGMDMICGMGESIVMRHEMDIIASLYRELAAIKGVKLYTMPPTRDTHVPLLSFNVGDISADRVGELLGKSAIAVRAGYHCAYDAHAAYGTQHCGTVRICPSVFTSRSDCEALLRAVYNIAKNQSSFLT